MKITKQFLATLPADVQTFLTGHGWLLHHSTLAALPQTLNTLLDTGHVLHRVVPVDDANLLVCTTRLRKRALPRKYTWQTRGVYAHVRQLFPHVGDEYTVAELQDLTREFPWQKVVGALSKLRRLTHGMDVKRDTQRGVYTRLR